MAKELTLAPRSLATVRAEMTAAEITSAKLRKLLNVALRSIRARRFQPWIEEINARGILVKKRNPLLKDVREYSATLKSIREHLVALRAEENKLQQHCADGSEWDEFRVAT